MIADLQQTRIEPTGEDTEALELAHQQELQDVEERLTDKHKKELENLETQLKSRLDDMAEKHQLEVERLRTELLQAQQALDQYPDTQEEVMSPLQAVPTVSHFYYIVILSLYWGKAHGQDC